MIYFIGKYFNSFKQCSQSIEDTMKGKLLPVFLTTLSYKYCLCNGQMVNFFKCAKKYKQGKNTLKIKLHPVPSLTNTMNALHKIVCLRGSIYSHIGSICSTFLHCVL